MRSRIALIAVVAAASLAGIRLIGEIDQAGRRPEAPARTMPSPVLPKLIVPYSTGILPALDAPASDLLDYARGVAGRRFAGLWLDDLPPVGFRVGIVRPTVRDDLRIQRALNSIGTLGRVVPARFPEDTLKQINSYLGDRLAAANRGAAVPISVGERPDLNAIEVTVPAASTMTPRQDRFASLAQTNFGAAIRLTEAGLAGPYPEVIFHCRGVFCDPPLRSGIQTFTQAVGCTGGFIALSRTDRLPYQFTAGHCRNVPYQTWLTNFANQQAHVIGPIHRSVFGTNGDVGIVRVSNPTGWKPRGWVSVRTGVGTLANPEYRIFTEGDPVVGVRVCVSGGGSSAGSCGVITSVGVSAGYTYLGRITTVKGLARASFCAGAGDSGSPVFASNTAYGLLSGGARSASNQCSSLFEPIRTAENLMNVDALHESR